MTKNGNDPLPNIFGRADVIARDIERLRKDRDVAILAALRALATGATTGDPLLDNLWKMYREPPDSERIGRFRKAATLIEGQTGQLVALVEMKEGRSGIKYLMGERQDAAKGIHAPPEPSPSFQILLGRLTGDKLVFKDSGLCHCVLPTAAFAEIELYHSNPIHIRKGCLECLGFPDLLDVRLPSHVYPDHVFYIEEDLVQIRVIAGTEKVLAWAEEFHHGMCTDACRKAMAKLDRLGTASEPVSA